MLPAPFYELDQQIAIDLPGARAIFTTVAWGDVRQQQPVISERLGVAAVRPRQVHGTTVIQTSIATGEEILAEADAVATDATGVAPMIISADCVPIVISGCGAVAAVHAGWRGLDGGVIANGVMAVRRMGTADAQLTAAIGPCAGGCCYEVSEDLHQRFAVRGEDLRNGQNLMLAAIAARQLNAAGVATVHDASICTICSDPKRLYSYRRDGDGTGRQGAMIWLI